MNLFEFCKENIHMDKIENFKGDTHELAIIRYVMKEVSKIFYRDYTFFLNKQKLLEFLIQLLLMSKFPDL